MKWVLLFLQRRSNTYPRNGSKIITGMLQYLLVFSERITKVFMNFTKWKHDNICKVLYSTIKSRMNDLITKINASKWCKAFRVIN